jgi:hypothetical protein
MGHGLVLRERTSEQIKDDRYSEEIRPARRLFMPHIRSRVRWRVAAELP